MAVATRAVVDAPRRAAQRPVAWVILAATAVAVAAIGGVATAAILVSSGARSVAIPSRFWGALAAGTAAVGASFGLRTLRWAFLLRRAGSRIPIRDACIGYLSGFSLLFVPLLVGEVVTRAYVHHARVRVPAATTVSVNLWERMIDVAALNAIAAIAVAWAVDPAAAIMPGAIVAILSVKPFRAMALASIVGGANAIVTRVAPLQPAVAAADLKQLTSHRVWAIATGVSVAAWSIPGLVFWMLASSWRTGYTAAQGLFVYASSALSAGLAFAPGGVRVVGATLLGSLAQHGVPEGGAAITVLAIRVITAGLATVLGVMFVWLHVRTRSRDGDAHFDEIAHVYDAQIATAQRESLLEKKTTLMARAIARHGVGRRGLDAGCGQGWYVARMRQLGFDVRGIDASAGQIARARRQFDDPAVFAEGSLLRIDAPAGAFDFVYTINVLHHLGSIEQQRTAFAELLRVLKPGGLLFVHEINTRNLLFRFYMGYVFPSLNCIDEGTERWLLPHRLSLYTDAPVVDTAYFTFLPEFVPALVLRLFRPLEALLERSRLRVYSAHYMAVLKKPALRP